MEITVMSSATRIAMVVQIAIGFLLPLGLLFFWCKGKKLSFRPALVGMVTFVAMVYGFENAAHQLILTSIKPLQNAVMTNAIYFAIYGGLMSGIFEECGRYFSINHFLKDYNTIEDGVSFGIGHGGIEMLIIVGFSILSNLLTYNTILAKGIEGAYGTAITPEQTTVLVDTLNKFATIAPGMIVASIVERIFAIILHISLSVIIFIAVKNHKKWLLPVSILLHALVNFPAGLYQANMIKNVFIVETLVGVVALGCAAFAIYVYKTFGQTIEVPAPKLPKQKKLKN